MAIRVLFVDDEAQILQLLSWMMQKQAWHIEYALGGQQALQVLARVSFDVLVTDLNMPIVDGVKLLSIAKTKYPNMARVVLSGDVDDVAFKQALTNAHAYLKKPFNQIELATTIKKVSLPFTSRKIHLSSHPVL